ncbi:MAG: flagellar protein FlgN [Firmicutes bacterium]|nr:flagellar protein FlgN [Bacillota bacterium]
MSGRTQQVALCLGEARALTRTARAMQSALVAGDAEAVRELVEEQEVAIWRLGRLLQGEDVEGARAPEEFSPEAAGADEEAYRERVRQAWLGEMAALAEVSRQNAVLVRDGLVTVAGLLRILTGGADDYGGAVGGPRLFSRRA